MYIYKFKPGDNICIKTPHVNSFDEIQIKQNQSAECITNHSKYPNGLELDITQFADKVIISSNKRIILSGNNELTFED